MKAEGCDTLAAQSASNLIMTRARAKYGQRLTKKNYTEMSDLGSVVEVADYLSNTDYGGYIDTASKSFLHRKNLEQVLRRGYISETERFCRYEASVGEHIFEYFLMEREIQSLLNFIHLLSIGRQREFIFTFSKSFESFISLDLSALSGVETNGELKAFLSKTRYKKIAGLLPADNSTDYDFSIIETALDRMLYSHVLSIASVGFPDSAKKELSDIFNLKSELLDLMMIFRAKRFFNESPHYIRSNLIGNRYLFTAAQLEEMISANDSREIFSVLKSKRYFDEFLSAEPDKDLDFICHSIFNSFVVKKIHYSNNPAVVMTAYLLTKQTELENIFKIIEGVRYNIPQKTILNSLIIKEA